MCNKCSNNGYVCAYDRKDGYLYTFRCDCPNGERRKCYGLWDDSKLKHYTLKMPEKNNEDPPQKNVSNEIKKDYKVLAADPKAYDDDYDDEVIPF